MTNNIVFDLSSTNFLKNAPWVFIWLFLLSSPLLHAQRYHYHQYIKGNKVGTLTAQKIADSSGTRYVIDSDVTLNYLLGKTEVIYHAEANYERNRLVKSTVRVEKNGNLRDYSETWRNEEGYWAQVEGEKIKLPWNGIEYSALMLYLDEPQGIDSLYSEAHGRKNKVIYTGEGHYKVDVAANNNINEFQYKKGILQKAVLDHWLAAIHLKLIEHDDQHQ